MGGSDWKGKSSPRRSQKEAPEVEWLPPGGGRKLGDVGNESEVVEGLRHDLSKMTDKYKKKKEELSILKKEYKLMKQTRDGLARDLEELQIKAATFNSEATFEREATIRGTYSSGRRPYTG